MHPESKDSRSCELHADDRLHVGFGSRDFDCSRFCQLWEKCSQFVDMIWSLAPTCIPTCRSHFVLVLGYIASSSISPLKPEWFCRVRWEDRVVWVLPPWWNAVSQKMRANFIREETCKTFPLDNKTEKRGASPCSWLAWMHAISFFWFNRACGDILQQWWRIYCFRRTAVTLSTLVFNYVLFGWQWNTWPTLD